MTEEQIARKVIYDFFASERTLRRGDIPQNVWAIVCEELQGHDHAIDLVENGEITAWDYVSTDTQMDDYSDHEETHWAEREPEYMPNITN